MIPFNSRVRSLVAIAVTSGALWGAAPAAQAYTVTTTNSPGGTPSVPYTYGHASSSGDTITFPSRTFYRSPAYSGTQTVKIQYLEFAKTRSYNPWGFYQASPVYTAYPSPGQSVSVPAWSHYVIGDHWWHAYVQVTWFAYPSGVKLGTASYDYSNPNDYQCTSDGGYTCVRGWDSISGGNYAYMYMF